MSGLSANTQAILLLTAPLINGKRDSSGPQLLSVGAYRKLAAWLHGQSLAPADFLGRDAEALCHTAQAELDLPELSPLLQRGFQLSQAIERWNQRGIWVVSRADARYPKRFKERLGQSAPPIVYGCGDAHLLARGGLAIVGSRNVSEAILTYAADVARRCTESGFPVVSGGARGVDQAAMQGAGAAHGNVIGVLADSLERAVIKREHREALMNGSMVLCSPYDPQAGFNAGHAMQRNKLVYALSDAALIMNSDFEKGGTWAGAVEQLESFKQIPLYVRRDPKRNKALDALLSKGAHPWPDPSDNGAFEAVFSCKPVSTPEESPLGLFETLKPDAAGSNTPSETRAEDAGAAAVLEECVRHLILSGELPVTEHDLASRLAITKPQARQWLKHLCDQGVLVRRTRPVRYDLSS